MNCNHTYRRTEIDTVECIKCGQSKPYNRKEIVGTVKAQEEQLKEVIKDYCDAVGCKECPFKNNCLAVSLEESIWLKEQRLKSL